MGWNSRDIGIVYDYKDFKFFCIIYYKAKWSDPKYDKVSNPVLVYVWLNFFIISYIYWTDAVLFVVWYKWNVCYADL